MTHILEVYSFKYILLNCRVHMEDPKSSWEALKEFWVQICTKRSKSEYQENRRTEEEVATCVYMCIENLCLFFYRRMKTLSN